MCGLALSRGDGGIQQVHWEELIKEARDRESRLRASHARLLAEAATHWIKLTQSAIADAEELAL